MVPITAPPISMNILFRNTAHLLGTNIAAVVAYEDRVALNYLRERSDVLAERAGCIGLSGGGLRAAILRATHDLLGPCVIAGMMSTYDELIDRCVAPHTWMLFPAGWSQRGDWPDLAASAAPAPLLIQYLLDDAVHNQGHAGGGCADGHARPQRPRTRIVSWRILSRPALL
jgi:hypothetical protein